MAALSIDFDSDVQQAQTDIPGALVFAGQSVSAVFSAVQDVRDDLRLEGVKRQLRLLAVVLKSDWETEPDVNALVTCTSTYMGLSGKKMRVETKSDEMGSTELILMDYNDYQSRT